MDSNRLTSIPSWLSALLDWSALANIPEYRVCAWYKRNPCCATLSPTTAKAPTAVLDRSMPVTRVYRMVPTAAVSSMTVSRMSPILTGMKGRHARRGLRGGARCRGAALEVLPTVRFNS
eukprot:CAMPEP_0198679722 /NCGR_PEP_ID=MMETSP1468-20131203/3296_1 /TAXON_ID=1461545 /ORGANISM="Mantoniella sp, Strain CCMP1436" /LENGTH=118 /DNA_ID=CAMNT_0044418835 /DNA_START=519 /DNA_END=875 /DNA_ORIENTATION=-